MKPCCAQHARIADVAKGYRIAPDNRKALRKLRQDGMRQLAHLPTFKKKFKRERFRYPQGFELGQERSRLKRPKLGWVKYINSRDVLGQIANGTISLHAGQWLGSIQAEREVPQPVPIGSSAVGVDVGVVNLQNHAAVQKILSRGFGCEVYCSEAVLRNHWAGRQKTAQG